MPAQRFNSYSIRLTGLAVAAMIVAAGCGHKPVATPAPARPAAAKAAAGPAETKPAEASRRSSFVASASSKNPFFPSSTRVLDPKLASAAASAGPTAVRTTESRGNALVLALQAGFQGIVGVGAERVALINNATLELDRDTWLSVVLDGHEQKIRVRPTQIMRGSITLQVNGQTQPIVLNVFKKK